MYLCCSVCIHAPEEFLGLAPYVVYVNTVQKHQWICVYIHTYTYVSYVDTEELPAVLK